MIKCAPGDHVYEVIPMPDGIGFSDCVFCGHVHSHPLPNTEVSETYWDEDSQTVRQKIMPFADFIEITNKNNP